MTDSEIECSMCKENMVLGWNECYTLKKKSGSYNKPVKNCLHHL